MERLATGNRAGVDSEAVSLFANPTDEALAEDLASDPYVSSDRRLGIRERNGSRRICLDGRWTRFRHNRFCVEKDRRVFIASDVKRSVEGRGQAKGDLDLLGVDERCQAPARAPTVRRGEWATEAMWKGDLHRPSDSRVRLGLCL